MVCNFCHTGIRGELDVGSVKAALSAAKYGIQHIADGQMLLVM